MRSFELQLKLGWATKKIWHHQYVLSQKKNLDNKKKKKKKKRGGPGKKFFNNIKFMFSHVV